MNIATFWISKNDQIPLVKIDMFEILSIFGNFWTKNKWHFFEFAVSLNGLKCCKMILNGLKWV